MTPRVTSESSARAGAGDHMQNSANKICPRLLCFSQISFNTISGIILSFNIPKYPCHAQIFPSVQNLVYTVCDIHCLIPTFNLQYLPSLLYCLFLILLPIYLLKKTDCLFYRISPGLDYAHCFTMTSFNRLLLSPCLHRIHSLK